MLKSNYKNSIITNSSIELQGDLSLEGNGKGRKFVSRFIEPGIAEYKGTFGKILITKETLDSFIMSMVGCPVIIKHKDITDKNVDQERVGVVSEVWYNEADGWYYCSGILFDKQAIDLVKYQGWSVSCTYDFETDNTKGTYHGLDYDMQFTGGEFLHLALVPNPRYERANIVVNSKDEEQTAEEISVVQNSLDTVLNAISEVFVECLGELKNSFPDHEGRPGEVGGSLPEGINQNYQKELNEVIKKAKESPNDRQKLIIGKVSSKLEKIAEENGFNIKGYNHDLDVSGTRHAIKDHGNSKSEEPRGQIAVTDEDFEKIPSVIYGYDNVSFGEFDKKGTPLIQYSKKFEDGTIIYVEEIRTRQKTLTIKSMWKTKLKADNSGIFTDFNPQRMESTSSIYIIPHFKTF